MRRRLLACAFTSSATWRASPASSSPSRRAAARRCTRRAAGSTRRRSTLPVRGAKAAGATEIVVMDCHGAGEGLDLQLAPFGSARSRVRVRRPGRVDGVHRVPRTGLRRGAFRRHARPCRHPRRCHEPHDLRSGLPEPLVQRHASRRDWDQCALCGTWGCPVLLVTGDEAAWRRDASFWRWPHYGGRRSGARALGADDPAAARSSSSSRRDEAGPLRPEGRPAVRPGQPVRDQGEFKNIGAPDKLRFRVDGSAWTIARSSHGPTRGGSPGSSSTSSGSWERA